MIKRQIITKALKHGNEGGLIFQSTTVKHTNNSCKLRAYNKSYTATN